MKRLLALVLAAVLVASLVPSAMAGEVGRATTKGFLLGIGSLLLFDALVNHVRAHEPAPVYAPPPVVYAPPPVVYAPPPAYAPAPPPARWVPGYWEQRWVPQPTAYDIWVPRHYNERGEWVEGHYERRATHGGYYAQVWVPGHWEPY